MHRLESCLEGKMEEGLDRKHRIFILIIFNTEYSVKGETSDSKPGGENS